MAEREISQKDVLFVLLYGEIIEKYPHDEPYPSALFLGWINKKPFHVVVALDDINDWAYIITAYEPCNENFASDFKTRRKP